MNVLIIFLRGVYSVGRTQMVECVGYCIYNRRSYHFPYLLCFLMQVLCTADNLTKNFFVSSIYKNKVTINCCSCPYFRPYTPLLIIIILFYSHHWATLVNAISTLLICPVLIAFRVKCEKGP